MVTEVSNESFQKSDSGMVVYGKKKIYFSIFRCKRKTLEIAVLPNRSVEVRAPIECTQEAIEIKVKKRCPWIIRQQAYFKQFDPKTPCRQYLGGETHLYLGKKYRLKIANSDVASVKMLHGFINVLCVGDTSPENVQKQLNIWYREKAQLIFNETYEKLTYHLQINENDLPTLQIRTMKTRWGSLSKNGTLTMNINLIKAPRECIEYVFVHELCHIQHNNHSKDFYKLLQSRMPDWQTRKQKLEAALI